MISKKHMLCALVAVGGAGMLYYVKAEDKYGVETLPAGTPAAYTHVLVDAIKRKDLEAVKYLVQHPSVDSNGDVRGRVPLPLALELGNLPIIEAMINAPRVEILQQMSGNVTPLIWAVRNGNIVVVNLLLNSPRMTVEAINIKSQGGKTALQIARTMRFTEIAELLKSKGATE